MLLQVWHAQLCVPSSQRSRTNPYIHQSVAPPQSIPYMRSRICPSQVATSGSTSLANQAFLLPRQCNCKPALQCARALESARNWAHNPLKTRTTISKRSCPPAQHCVLTALRPTRHTLIICPSPADSHDCGRDTAETSAVAPWFIYNNSVLHPTSNNNATTVSADLGDGTKAPNRPNRSTTRRPAVSY